MSLPLGARPILNSKNVGGCLLPEPLQKEKQKLHIKGHASRTHFRPDIRMSAEELGQRLLEALKRQPGQKGYELARLLGADRKEVNQCLTHDLAGKVQQDSSYRWSLRARSAPKNPDGEKPGRQITEIYRLCHYYLECIGQDSDEAVSVFASSMFGDKGYAELPALPISGTDWDWWNVSGVQRVLGSIKANPENLFAWVGYPVRLREHRTPKWRGFFVEPVLLWPIQLPENPGDRYKLADNLPLLNVSVFRSLAMGDPADFMGEAARLGEELGLNGPLDDRPEVDELLERLVAIRPDWDWQEKINPEDCSAGEPLAEINKAGIYNRAVVIVGKRSPYTQGLEAELKTIGAVPEPLLKQTALGGWLAGYIAQPHQPSPSADQPLIEVLPMNSEQRIAVETALVSPHTVVTGPPGTGKSQVVTNLLVNAAWRGMKVLFASKNNKAVDVIEARVNGLGNRPVLLRLGSNEYQAKLSSYLTAMLSGQVGEDISVSYEEGLAKYRKLAAKLAELDRKQSETMTARNLADRLESEAESARTVFGPERFNNLSQTIVESAAIDARTIANAVDAIDPSRLGSFGRLGLKLNHSRRVAALRNAVGKSSHAAKHLGLKPYDAVNSPDIAGIRAWLSQFSDRQEMARKVLSYQAALRTLRASVSFEEIARERLDLGALVAKNSARLWRDWVQLAPSRLTTSQRKDIADYAALLQVMTGKDAQSINAQAKAKARKLQASISSMFSCWAVTSLSAKGKVPLEPAHFDLVVIDEASQCDIASALPLLFRAKRAVIIGDPMQLRHISAVSRSKDSDLQNKYGLIEERAAWMYSVNSLYDVAAGIAAPHHIVNLRDHHRCHSDIIEFSNRAFYGGRLRVATKHAHLKRPRNKEPGIVWQDVKGRTTRPSGSGAQNIPEAKAVVDAVEDLLIQRGYKGSIGVVTPFRAQAQLIQNLVAQHPRLSTVGGQAELLVDTVHRFQGDERDVMFFSPVVAEGMMPGSLSYLRSNGNLFNVAITRARGLLHVVGDRSAASACGVDYLEEFAAYVGKIGKHAARVSDDGVPIESPDYPAVSHPDRVSDWERYFYKALYAAGIRPIPQYSVEQYDLDFAIIVGNRKLNIEIDGERYHRSWTGELCLRDQLRNQRLIELGWEVKRFWVYEIRDQLQDCVTQILAWIDHNRQKQ